MKANQTNLFFPFIEEIRKRLLLTLSIFIITSIIGFIYYEKILLFVLKIIRLSGINIVFTSPFQFINLSISSALLLGVLFSFPVLIYQFFSFLRPALRPKEFRLIISLLPISFILFIIGFGFGFLIMRYIINIFYLKSQELNIGNILDVSQLLSQVLLTAVLLGIASQYPVFMTILIRLGIVSTSSIARQRPFIYTAALVFAALLPPTDLLSLFLLTLPLVILFETTLLLNRMFMKKGVKKEVKNNV